MVGVTLPYAPLRMQTSPRPMPATSMMYHHSAFTDIQHIYVINNNMRDNRVISHIPKSLEEVVHCVTKVIKQSMFMLQFYNVSLTRKAVVTNVHAVGKLNNRKY